MSHLPQDDNIKMLDARCKKKKKVVYKKMCCASSISTFLDHVDSHFSPGTFVIIKGCLIPSLGRYSVILCNGDNFCDYVFTFPFGCVCARSHACMRVYLCVHARVLILLFSVVFLKRIEVLPKI